MRKHLQHYLLAGFLLFFSVCSFGTPCPMTVDFLLENPESTAWCNMECIDKMLNYVDHTSRTDINKKALSTGINKGRACAHEYYEVNGVSSPRWNEFVDKTNYMLHQAGIIGSHTKSSVSSSGATDAACRLSNTTPCASSTFSYGKALMETYKTGCMTDLDKQIAFTSLTCLYYLEAQQHALSDTPENASFFLSLLHQAQTYQSYASPYTHKITSKILADMERTLTGCYPDIAQNGSQGGYELDEVVVTPKSADGENGLAHKVAQAVADGACTNPTSHPGQPGSAVGLAGYGNGTGGGSKVPVDTASMWVGLPPDY